MLSGETLSKHTPRNWAIWWTLAFQAGAINTGGYLACHRFVTHTTGFATLFGTGLAEGDFRDAFGMLFVPIVFVIGAMISAFFIDRRRLQGMRPHYATVLLMITSVLVGITIGGQFGLFGTFGEPLVLTRDYTLLVFLSFISGLQNAMITSVSGSVVRTTHLTGLTTDLGVGLMRILSNSHKTSRDEETRNTLMRLGIIVSFVLGSASSGWIFFSHQYWGFALPATLSTILFWSTLKHRMARAASTVTT